MPEAWFTDAFVLWGSPTSWLELVAFALALAMVGCNIREIHWGWPLAAVTSVMYFGLFWRSKIYGDAALQVVFAAMAVWGWAQWLGGRRGDGCLLRVARLGTRGMATAVASGAVLWLCIGLFLRHQTDSDVPWWDAFPTAVSLVGQYLLGRKYLENWLAWIAVNTVSAGLFAFKGLWLTLLLYSLFAVLSVVGWRAWRQRLE